MKQHVLFCLLVLGLLCAAHGALNSTSSTFVGRTKRFLPPGSLNMAYVGGACDPNQIVSVVKNGVNVLFWFSISFVNDVSGQVVVSGGPDLDCAARVATQLTAMNLPTTHMMCV